MLETLHAARRQPLRRVHDAPHGKPPWPASWQTLYALTRRGLLEHARRRSRRGYPVDEWQITPAGREALIPPPPRVHRPRLFLTHPIPLRRGDYTGLRRVAIDDVEAIDADDLSIGWQDQAALRHAEAADRATRARRLARSVRV